LKRFVLLLLKASDPIPPVIHIGLGSIVVPWLEYYSRGWQLWFSPLSLGTGVAWLTCIIVAD